MPSKKYHHGDLKNALIQAGIEILSKDGVAGLSLRKVALRAKVSHSAPYAHFSDKQSLIAAISTEGFNQLYAELSAAIEAQASDPEKKLFAATKAYVTFALARTDTFKIMFSGVIEKEKEYPAFVEVSQRTFRLVVDVVRECQKSGLLPAGQTELVAVSLWAQIHGIVSLALEGQIPHAVIDQNDVQAIVDFAFGQIFAGKK